MRRASATPVLFTILVATLVTTRFITPAAAGSTALPGRPGEEVPQRVVDEAVRSVGKVRSAGVTGSGWVVARDTVVTNFHVARGGTGDIFIDYSDGGSVECYTAAADRDRDLAVLKCPTDDRPALTVDDRVPRPGTAVATIGYPEGVGPTISRGEITEGRIDVHGITTLGYTAETAPGSSGSPVIDEAGAVRAIVTFSGGLGVPSADLTPLLDRALDLPATKVGAEWRLRIQRSIVAAVVVAALRVLVLWRRGRRRRILAVGALQGAVAGIVLALVATQVQFMAAGPTMFS